MISTNTNVVLILKNWHTDTFEMIDLGILSLFLGLEVFPLYDDLFIIGPIEKIQYG